MDDETILNSPEFKRRLAESAVRTVGYILEQEHLGTLVDIRVKRTGTLVEIAWQFKSWVKEDSRYRVYGGMREMSLFPDESYNMDQLIAKGYGNGSLRLNLEEGGSYYFDFRFFDGENIFKKIEEQGSKQAGMEFYDFINFQVAVPLADKNRAAVRKLLDMEKDPQERAKHEVEKFVGLRDTFEEELRQGIEHIKLKRLSPDEEEDKIGELKDFIANLKDRMGM
jgi:hypothetical protein